MSTSSNTQYSFTDFFIDRPVFSWVVNIIMVLLGIIAFFQLSTRQYPIVEKPYLTVRAEFSGSAQVIEEQITKVLEESFGSLQSLERISSQVQKNENITGLTFQESRSVDAAAADVREVLSRLQDKLPEHAKIIVTKGNVKSPPVMEVLVTGESHVPLTELHEVAEKTLKSAIESVPGVAVGEVIGGSELNMKIMLNREKLYSYHVNASELSRFIKESSIERSLGYLKEENRQFSLTAKSALNTPEEFLDLLIPLGKTTQGHNPLRVRLGDLANVVFGQTDEMQKVFFNGKPAVSVVVIPQSNSNPIEISKQVRERIAHLQKMLPKDIVLDVGMDQSVFIKRSIDQVYRAIFEAIILVLLVIFVFLRSFSASLIPLITIPISLISTFFIMDLLGFTINILSLLAIVLAIGLVVDDAIVVLENVHRYVEQGKNRIEAARQGCREIRFSVIAMTLTLAAVYAPIALVPGSIGKMFKEFALTLAGAVIISGIVALTLSPSMCKFLVRPHTHFSWAPLERFSQGTERFLKLLEAYYVKSVEWAIAHRKLVAGVALGLSVAGGLSYTRLNRELLPSSDEGTMRIRVYPPSTRNLNYLAKLADPVDKIIATIPEVSTRVMTVEMGEGRGKIVLKPWESRSRTCKDIKQSLQALFDEKIVGTEVYVQCDSSSPIRASSGSGADSLEMVLLSNKSTESLRTEGRKLRKLLHDFPGVEYVERSESVDEVGYNVKLHRDRIAQLGLTPEEVIETLRIFVRGAKICNFEKNKRTHDVVLELPDSEKDIEKVPHFFIRGRNANNENTMIPLRELITFEQKAGEATINRTDRKGSFSLQAYLKKGYSPLSVFEAFQREAESLLPTDYELRADGELLSLQKESKNIYMVFVMAVVFIFLVMAAQFESFLSPLIIMLTVPLALAGGILTLSLVFGIVSIYGQIGLITLIGLITKHGILLVDFAEQGRKEHGFSMHTAILEACKLRLRPILMTTLAMVLGALPLAFASGPGYEARQQIGWVIAGGMTIGTFFTLFVVPCVFLFFMEAKEKYYARSSV